MKRWVDFDIGSSWCRATAPHITVRGFEGSTMPIDKLAEFVLSRLNTAWPVKGIVVDYGANQVTTHKVVATSETT